MPPFNSLIVQCIYRLSYTVHVLTSSTKQTTFYVQKLSRSSFPADVSKQKYALFSKISKNYLTMGITWDTIAHCLDEFVSHKDLALQLRKHESCKIEKEIDTESTYNKINVCFLSSLPIPLPCFVLLWEGKSMYIFITWGFVGLLCSYTLIVRKLKFYFL